jgi:hypothetical protein
MGERSGHVLAGSGGLSSHVYARYRVGDREAFLQHHTLAFCTKAITAKTKVLTNWTLGSQKALGVAR